MQDYEWIAKKIMKILKRKTTKGKINELIDLICHPFFGKTCGVAEIVDFILHCVNEGEINLQKFTKYNLKSLIRSLLKVMEKCQS